jgi:hypothetical protein
MTKFYTAIFTDKTTGNVIFRLNKKAFDPVNWPGYTKFDWEKAKAVALDKLVKDRFISKENISISDHTGVI